MKLASLKTGGRDGTLVVVNRALTHCRAVPAIARSLQATPEAVINLFVTRDGSLDNLRHSIREDKTLDLVLSKAEKVKGA